MDEVRFWAGARTAEELRAYMYQSVDSTSKNLIAYYNFNQGVADGNNASITTLRDLTRGNYTGTLINFTLQGAISNWVRSGAPVLETQ